MSNEESPNWDRIVDRHADRVFRVAFRILGSAPDAEDVSQDVFLEAFRLHQAGPVQSWEGLLVRLATLRSLDRLRRNRPAATLREGDRVSHIEPYDEIAADELRQLLRNAIANLPDRQAAVFVMFYLERFTRDEIAATLGVSAEAVSTALYKARQRLLSQLAVFNRGGLP